MSLFQALQTRGMGHYGLGVPDVPGKPMDMIETKIMSSSIWHWGYGSHPIRMMGNNELDHIAAAQL